MKNLAACASLVCLVGACTICSSCKHIEEKEQSVQIPQEGRPFFLELYECGPEYFKGKDLLVVGRCYFEESRFQEATTVFEKYTADDALDPHGWISVGNANFALKRWNEAIVNYQKADALGHPEAVRMLAACYAGSGEFDNVRGFTPRLKIYIRGKPERSRERYEAIGLVLASAVSMEPPSKQLFDEFVGYLPTRVSDWPDDFREYAFEGFRLFGIPKRFQNAVKSKDLKPSDHKE